MPSRLDQALNRLAKWRMVFTGWQLGTRAKEDGESAAVSDHREATIFLRAEMTALVNLLLEKGVFTKTEFDDALELEARKLSEDNEARFPGMHAEDHGMVMDMPEAAETMKRLHFPH